MDEADPDVVQQNNWFVMVDPTWETGENESLPVEMMVGGWMLNEDGSAGPFQPNPHYKPSSEDVPSDPIDAILRRIAGGDRELGDDLVSTVRNSVVEVGCNDEDQLLIGTSPDGADCVVIATAELQKANIDVERWIPVHGGSLTQIVPEGTDILLNPSGFAPFRLVTAALQRAEDSEEEKEGGEQKQGATAAAKDAPAPATPPAATPDAQPGAAGVRAKPAK